MDDKRKNFQKFDAKGEGKLDRTINYTILLSYSIVLTDKENNVYYIEETNDFSLKQ